MINSEFLDGLTIEAAKDKIAEPAGRARHRRAQGQLPHARLAAVAPALLGLPDPGHPLREGRHRAGAGRRAAGEAAGGRHLRQAGQPARPSSDLEARDVPQVRRRRRARDRHHGHLRRQLLVPVPLHRAQRADADRQEGAQILGAGRPVHRRQGARGAAPAVRALLHARHEGDQARHVRRAVHVRCSRRASSCTRPTAARTATG